MFEELRHTFGKGDGITTACVPPLPKEAAAYMHGCNIEIKEGELLFTADQMRERDAMWLKRLADPNPEESLPGNRQPLRIGL